jgi:hypothetical protein
MLALLDDNCCEVTMVLSDAQSLMILMLAWEASVMCALFTTATQSTIFLHRGLLL